MQEILFEVTKEHLETGMRGYPVGYCNTSYVDPNKGLFYRGLSVFDLSNWEPERVIYLLYYGQEGSASCVRDFSRELKKRSCCSQSVLKQIKGLPRQGHPMKLLCSALLILGIFEGQTDYQEDCLNLIAKIPHLVATVINHHAGWEVTSTFPEEMGYMERFAHLVQVPNAEKKSLAEVFRLFNILHYDHGGGNLSAFVGKAVASGLEDMHGAICSAMCALAGPRHGKANQDCFSFVQSILGELGEGVTAEQLETLVRKRVENGELIYGFGHAVLRKEDPRASILYELAQNKFATHPLVKIALKLRNQGVKVLKGKDKVSNPYPNVDAISGTVLTAAGFAYPEYFTLLFGMARSVGIAVQIVYERCQARKGKGTPIVRPRYLFKP